MSEHVEFRKEMKKTHTILIPMMLPIHFRFLENILKTAGYRCALLQNEGDTIIDEGLRNVHNDTCYPALLVIGQMIDALKSGQYDVNHIALAITQTGGGCRASNYIHLLRKALIQAGFPQVPVISVSFSNLEKHSGFKLGPKLLLQIAVGFLYGDYLMWIANQVKPYELKQGTCEFLISKWIDTICAQFSSLRFLHIKRNAKAIVQDFHDVATLKKAKVKIGIVGEIYMKYAPLGNHHLEEFLQKEDCECVVSGVLDFALYCLENTKMDHQLYGRNKKKVKVVTWGSNIIQKQQEKLSNILRKDGYFRVPTPFKEVMEGAQGIIHKGAKMGEGWLLTSEMVDFVKHDVLNIVCCQPFGCLPNHIVAKGMMRKIKQLYPNSNIVALDYDPSATYVNQENRLKLMLANAQLQSAFEKTKPSPTTYQARKEFAYDMQE